MLRKNRKGGQSAVEYVAMIVILMIALLYFQKYIVRSLSGRWKGVGDGLGQGRIYDPLLTTECTSKKFFKGMPSLWYNQACFDANCHGACLLSTRSEAKCTACLLSCASPLCKDPETPL